MFQTNPPEFDSVPEQPASSGPDQQNAGPAPESAEKRPLTSDPMFATLAAFSAWMDLELAELEANHEGFETVSSVRGFYGR